MEYCNKLVDLVGLGHKFLTNPYYSKCVALNAETNKTSNNHLPTFRAGFRQRDVGIKKAV